MKILCLSFEKRGVTSVTPLAPDLVFNTYPRSWSQQNIIWAKNVHFSSEDCLTVKPVRLLSIMFTTKSWNLNLPNKKRTNFLGYAWGSIISLEVREKVRLFFAEAIQSSFARFSIVGSVIDIVMWYSQWRRVKSLSSY